MKYRYVLYMAVINISLYLAKSPVLDVGDIAEVRDFIKKSWEKTVRFSPEDSGQHIGLPYRYTVPSISDSFQALYYWDTYFTGEGLILDGHIDLAISNVENMLYLVERYGKMLNGNRTFFENRSQPPFLSMMIESIYRKTFDKEWLARVLPNLEKEYLFWMTHRMTPVGLNRYSNEATLAQKRRIVDVLKKRLGPNFRKKVEYLSEGKQLEIASHYIAEAESGWDFTPRFDMRCEDFCPVDLNSNLYYYEKNFEYFAYELGNISEAKIWAKRAERRRWLMYNYMRDKDTGMYYDYDFINDKRSDIISAAVFHLLYAGVVSKREARRLKEFALKSLEYPYGIVACEKRDYGFNYQWSYPNGWAPFQFIAMKGLERYDFCDDALRIALGYVSMVVSTYKVTHNLWEKYNVVEGNTNVMNEYEMPSMVGWTAGVFSWAVEFIDRII